MRDNRTVSKLFALLLLIIIIFIGSVFVRDKADPKRFITDVNRFIQYFDDLTGEDVQLIPLPPGK